MSKFNELDRSTQANLKRLYNDEASNVPTKVVNKILKTQATYRLLGGTVLGPQTIAMIVSDNDPKMGVTVEETTGTTRTENRAGQ